MRRSGNARSKRTEVLNEVVIHALARAMDFAGEPVRQRDVSDISGTWREDPLFDQAIVDQHTIDEELWT